MNSPLKNSNHTPHIFEFDEFTFDADNNVLFKDDEIIQLAPKACELLAALLENAGKIIGKDQLMNRVWNDSFVEEANLAHHISSLRKALGEDKNGRKFIETIPRRGYRFVAPITEANSGAIEIVISERVTTHAIEEIEIETDATEKIENDQNQAVLEVSPNFHASSEKTLKTPGKSSIRQSFYVFAIFSLIVLIVSAGIFGNRLFSVKSPKSFIVPLATVQKRIAPDIDAVNPAISPDGKNAVFLWYKNGQSSVWQKNTATGETTQLTADAPLSESQKWNLKYSSDGQWIYYSLSDYKNNRQEVYRITAIGGSPQRIIENIADLRGEFSFSPDGKQIAYVVWNNMQTALMIADAETGKSREAARRDEWFKIFGHPTGVFSPAWSPDGKRILIGGLSEKGEQRTYELIEVDAETGGEKLIPISENLRIYELEWLADNSGLVATVSEATGVPKQIAHISYPDGKIDVLTNDDFGYDYIRLTKDSRTMIAGKDVGSVNLWTADAKNLSQRKQITIGGNALQGTNSIAFASDGRIIFSSPQNGSIDLWSVMSDGSGLKQLTKNTGKWNAVSGITPDNRYIIYNSIRSGTNQVWRMDADGGNPVQLSRTGPAKLRRTAFARRQMGLFHLVSD